MLPANGKLLISEPFMGDPNFERSVVMLCEHNAKGSFGLVLNQKTNLTLSDVMDGVYVDLPIYLGGPVEQNTLHFLHRLGNQVEGTIDVGNGIYWAGDFDNVKTLINIGVIKEQDIRLFVGYSGWGVGQLDNEIKRNSWIISETSADFIFDTPSDQFWRAILKNMGGEYKVLSNYPIDPRLN
jgi:putative transcriptional regulator